MLVIIIEIFLRNYLNRSYFALFVALLIHILLLLIFWLFGTITPEIEKKENKKENKIKISLKEMPKKHKDSGDIKKEDTKKPKEIAPPMPKGSQLKKIENSLQQKPPIEFKPKKVQPTKSKKLPMEKAKSIVEQKKVEQKIKKESKVEIKQPKIEPLPPTKPYIPLTSLPTPPKKEKESKKESYDWLYEDRSKEEKKTKKSKKESGSNIGNSNLKELYGDEFGKLTPGQQKYLIDNQEIMRRITQEVLNRVARVNLSRDINVNSTNIVEFYLHPNGDMTDFKFLKKSGYYVLDDTTKETIEYAYSRYPRPNEKILVRYNVFYNLAGY
jgi:outer membrane biosynthesis protein TonB